MEIKMGTDHAYFEKLEAYLPEIYPDIKVTLLDVRFDLYNECFLTFAPCDMTIEATKEQMQEIVELAKTHSDDERYVWLGNFFGQVLASDQKDFIFFTLK